ncbi:hypothetical protein [Mesorhizobium sp. 1M-11]|uniref:hypothetical protein n=1 Tax=Mesorhizobium sp. 1M-11 TaxID=1529006 RepID=UPI0006C76105|nr:hypothetical protein [Mesorhizobium sp. 1M-11]
MTLYHELLTELIPLVEKKLEAHRAEAGEFHFANYDAWEKRCALADERIREFFSERYDARFTEHGDTHTVHMAGFRSSSTSGWAGALRNWQSSAEKKLAAHGDLDGFNPHGSGPVPIEPREG